MTQAFFQIPYGIASDLWGRKLVIVIGLLVFVAVFLTSLIAALEADVLGNGGEVIEMDEPDADRVESAAATLADFGLLLERFGPTALLVRAVPAVLGKGNVQALVRDIADDLLEAGVWLFLRGGPPTTPWHSLPQAQVLSLTRSTTEPAA